MNDSRTVQVVRTEIPGLLKVTLPVHEDARGWFKENWQREKMVAAGLPDFRPVQNNISFNVERGTTRGLHAEPWDKYVSVAAGEIFGAWVDLRPGETFGSVFYSRIGPNQAFFVPRGVANGFQTLSDNTVYSYLVTEHWTENSRKDYSYVNVADPQLSIPWPISLDEVILSSADREHPLLSSAKAVQPQRIAVLGRNGQLGREFVRLAELDSRIVLFDRSQADFQKQGFATSINLAGFSHVINAAAMTAVDRAETEPGRSEAWRINAVAVAELAARCATQQVQLIHVSTDYVFDGATPEVDEFHPVAPLGVYGQSKAAGEQAVLAHPNNFVVRTSWVVGKGNNFISTMRRLAQQGVSPNVVDDQFGRVTFASELARGIMHLIDSDCEPGIYHLQGVGQAMSWYELACDVFELCGKDSNAVQPLSTEQYMAQNPQRAPRPRNSTFNARKFEASGFVVEPNTELLKRYLDYDSAVL